MYFVGGFLSGTGSGAGPLRALPFLGLGIRMKVKKDLNKSLTMVDILNMCN